jgi:hypothetical protein
MSRVSDLIAGYNTDELKQALIGSILLDNYEKKVRDFDEAASIASDIDGSGVLNDDIYTDIDRYMEDFNSNESNDKEPVEEEREPYTGTNSME